MVVMWRPLFALSFVWLAEGLVVQRSSSTVSARLQRPLAYTANDDGSVLEDDIVVVETDGVRSRLPPFAVSLETAIVEALRGQTKALSSMLAPDVEWQNPMGASGGLEAVLGGINEYGSFFEAADRHLTLLDAKGEGQSWAVRWVASANLENAWRPRVRVYGTSRLTVNNKKKITSVEDEWDKDSFAVFREQVTPQFWDVYDLFNTPVAERPFAVKLDDQMGLPRGCYLERSSPTLAVRVELLDLTNSRSMRIASALPDFAMAWEVNAAGKKKRPPTRTMLPTTAVSPLAVTVELMSERETKVRRVRWDVPVHSRFGFDSSKLPPLPTAEALSEDYYLRERWASDLSMTYVYKPSANAVVATFDGDVQDAEAEDCKNMLIEAAKEAGLNVAEPPVFEHRRHRAKVGFDDSGRINFAAYFPKRPFPIKQNQLALIIPDSD